MTQGQTYPRCGAVSIRLSRVLLPGLRRCVLYSRALRQVLPAATILILLPAMALAHEPGASAELRFYATIVLWMSAMLFVLLMMGVETDGSGYLLAILLSSLMPLALLMIILLTAVRAKDAANTLPSTPPGIEAPPEGTR